MADGTIDLARASTIASRTRVMTDADAAYADEVLAAAAPGLRPDQLARKAAALELKLAPEAVRARKELARQLDQRVEARREESGNASLSGRELDTADVIASKAYIDAVAVRLRDSGLVDGTLGQPPRPGAGRPHPGPRPPRPHQAQPARAEHPELSVRGAARPTQPTAAWPLPRRRRPEGSLGPDARTGSLDDSPARPGRPGDPAPVPALINLLVPVGTLLGWDTAPAQAAGWGLLDADETRALDRGRRPAPENPLVPHRHRPRRHRHRPRLRHAAGIRWKPPRPGTPEPERKPGGIPGTRAGRPASRTSCAA